MNVVLMIVLAINAAMLLGEFTAGVIAGSVALMANAVDMFGDAMVYGLSLYALDRSERWRNGAAVAKGAFILLFGLGVLVQVAIKIQNGVPPSSTIMFGVGALALAADLVCLALLWRFRKQDLNMSSTFECSRNDVIANSGVLVAAGGVAAAFALARHCCWASDRRALLALGLQRSFEGVAGVQASKALISIEPSQGDLA